MTRVGDGDHDILAGRDVRVFGGVAVVEIAIRRLDRQLAAVGHRVARIDREIDDGAFQFVLIDFRRPESAGKHSLKFDRRAKRAAHHIGNAGDELVRVERPRRQRLPS